MIECLKTNTELLTVNNTTLYWILGHSGVEGNEMVDWLARKGSNSPFQGQESRFEP